MNAAQLARRVYADVTAGKATSRLDRMLAAASVDQLRDLLAALNADDDNAITRLLSEIAEAEHYD